MPKTLKYSIIMFAAGCCYGIVVPLVRNIYAQGFFAPEVMVAQYLCGFLMLTILTLLFFRRKIEPKDLVKLAGVGFLAAGVSFFYYRALGLLPSATALTLLFQFVWMGVVAQVIRERKAPKAMTVIAMLVVVLGTVLATGVLEGALESLGGLGGKTEEALPLDPLGVFYGLLSAVFYTLFLIASGKTATHLPAINRTHLISLGSLTVSFAFCPVFFGETLAPNITNGSFLLPVLALSVMGIVMPAFLIATSSPHLPNGLATIMASSELPSGILCAMLFMGDAVSAPVALGIAIILVGIVLSQGSDLRGYFKRRKV